ncbi:hypothetical protein BGZ49_005742 [Haplosporangium sp. Z 27]|nr:hypothetical protein BGZ49_005742 [Haplosporangium sp. Z 27]
MLIANWEMKEFAYERLKFFVNASLEGGSNAERFACQRSGLNEDFDLAETQIPASATWENNYAFIPGHSHVQE